MDAPRDDLSAVEAAPDARDRRAVGAGRIAVIVNRAAGAPSDVDRAGLVRAAFTRAGADVELRETEPERIGDAVRDLVDAGYGTIVAAGGDGTVSAVAARVAGTRARLGVLPMGTLNHFARDAGIPVELDAAAAVVVGDGTRRVDVGSVNGRTFLNNASLGLYPEQVRLRARMKHRLWKWVAAFVAGAVALRRIRTLWITVEADGRRERRRCPMIVVGNGEYDPASPMSRQRLDGGTLSFYVVTETRRVGLVVGVLRGLLGKGASVRGVERRAHAEATVHVPRRRVPVAIDGEVTTLRSPLRFRSEAGALRLAVPAKPA